MTGILTMLAFAAPLQEDWEKPVGRCEAAELAHEVSMLNLVNGLHLSPDQMKTIGELARAAGERRSRYAREQEGVQAELAGALRRLRETLVSADPAIPSCTEQEVTAAEQKVKRLEAEYHQDLRALERKLVAVLTPSQLEVIRRFNPCLIPPPGLKNPVRAGQEAGELAEIEMHLDHIRNLPKKPYETLIEPLARKLVAEWGVFLRFTPEQAEAEVRRLRKVADTARSLSNEDFALRKAELASEVLRPFLDVQAKVEELGTFFDRFSPVGKPGKWLLNPRIVPLLEAKLKAAPAARTATGEHTAESCREPASCGLHGRSDPDTGTCRCGKLTFAGLCNRFGVPEAEREPLRAAIARMQVRILSILCEPTPDGRIPLVELFTRPEKGPAILFETAEGRQMSYAARAGALKGMLHQRLRRAIGAEAFRRFEDAHIDLFEVHVGNLNDFEAD